MGAGAGSVRRVIDPAARARLAALLPRIEPGVLAAERTVPVHPALSGVFPQGLTRGSTVLCSGPAAASAALLAAVGATRAGAWVAVAGLPSFGAAAYQEIGGVLERVVAVREPAAPAVPGRPGRLNGPGGPNDVDGFDDGMWCQVLGAMIDGFEVIVFGAPGRVHAATARRLQMRLQSRGGVLIVVGSSGPFVADAHLATNAEWHGLGTGFGHLRTRRVTCSLTGRRLARPRRDVLWFPGPSGQIERVAGERTAGEPAQQSGSPRLRRTG